MAVQTKKTRRATRQTPKQTIAAAAKRNGVPVWALMGVKLMETGSGAGANPFQFEPSTAAGMGVKDVNNLSESADGAARLLRQYHDKYGTWDAAFEAYNGGPGAVGQGFAYNESDVKSKLHEFGYSGKKLVDLETPFGPDIPFPGPDVPFTPFGGLPGAGGGLLDGGGSIGGLLDLPDEALQAASSVTALVGMITSIDFWIRVGEAIAALILIYMGLHALTGQGPSPTSVAQTATAAAVAAK